VTSKFMSPLELAVFEPSTVPFIEACALPFGVNPVQETCTTVPGGPLVGVIITEIDALAGGITAKATIDAVITNIARIIVLSGFFKC